MRRNDRTFTHHAVATSVGTCDDASDSCCKHPMPSTGMDGGLVDDCGRKGDGGDESM